LSLSESSSSVDFQLSDLTARISSASIRIASLSSLSSVAGNDIAQGDTIARDVTSLEDPERLVRRYLSALELDYSDDLSAELSDKRIADRIGELSELPGGISQAIDTVRQLALAREEMLNDRIRGVTAPVTARTAATEEDFRDRVLRAIQERFGLNDANGSNVQVALDNNLRGALNGLLQVQSSSQTRPNQIPSSSSSRNGLSSIQPTMDNTDKANNRIISSAEPLVRDFPKGGGRFRR
jgi:hypothetical protein